MGCLSFLHAASNQSPLELAISAADYFEPQSDVFKTTSSSPPRRPQRDRQPSPNTVVAAPCAKNIIPKNNAAEATNITSPKAVRISNSATANSNTRIKRSFIKIPHATASTMNLSISNSLQTLFHWMVTAPARLKKPGVQRPQLHRPQTVRSSTHCPDVCLWSRRGKLLSFAPRCSFKIGADIAVASSMKQNSVQRFNQIVAGSKR